MGGKPDVKGFQDKAASGRPQKQDAMVEAMIRIFDHDPKQEMYSDGIRDAIQKDLTATLTATTLVPSNHASYKAVSKWLKMETNSIHEHILWATIIRVAFEIPKAWQASPRSKEIRLFFNAATTAQKKSPDKERVKKAFEATRGQERIMYWGSSKKEKKTKKIDAKKTYDDSETDEEAHTKAPKPKDLENDKATDDEDSTEDSDEDSDYEPDFEAKVAALREKQATREKKKEGESNGDTITKGTKRGRVQSDDLDSDEEKRSSENKRAKVRDEAVAASTAKRLVHFISDMAKDPEEVQIQVIQRCFMDGTLQAFLFQAELTPRMRAVVMGNAKR